jgi:tetratricopeptide (TPR) repeat protein
MGYESLAQKQMNRSLSLYPAGMNAEQMFKVANLEQDRYNYLAAGTLRLQAMNSFDTSNSRQRDLEDNVHYFVKLHTDAVYDFSIEAHQGDELAINVGSIRYYEDIDPVMVLVNDDGLVIASDDNSGQGYNASIHVSIPQSGTYRLLMSPANPDKLGLVFVALDVLNQASPTDLVASLAMSEGLNQADKASDAQIEFLRLWAADALNRADYAEAIPHLEWLIDHAPQMLNSYSSLGYAYTQVGRYQDAIDVYYAGLEAGYPNQAIVMLGIGDAYRLMGDARTVTRGAP